MKKIIASVLMFCLLITLLPGCGSTATDVDASDSDIPKIDGLTFVSETPLQYATCFRIFRYEDGYSVISVTDGRNYLVVPENGIVPENTGNFIILQKPFENIYLVATAAMSLLSALDSVSNVRLSGAKQESWYIEDAITAMKNGDMVYAGKYSEPDYELLLSKSCDLAIQSTMIYHSPDVQEKIEELGIPVFIERSSYENHPLGRTEWIKAYAVLMGLEDKADTVFSQQADMVESLSDFVNTEKTVAFFYVTTNGTVSVRKSFDYLATMIELAGGRYIFEDLGDPESATSSVTMTMEEFYAQAKDSDYLIYNATIDNPLDTVDELIAKSALFKDFKAVQNGNVWCTGKYLYQATDVLGGMIMDIHTILTDSAEGDNLTFVHKLS